MGNMMHRMSTSKPRITVTLEPTTAYQLRRVSELTGNSQSALVSEMLVQAEDVFTRLITVLEAAERAQAALSKSTVQGLVEAQQRIEARMGLVFDDFDTATAQVARDVAQKRPSVRGRGAR